MKSIIFSAAMVNAIRDGRKTQTRRVIKLPDWWEGHFNYSADGTQLISRNGGTLEHSPYGNVGDRLWVREGFEIQEFCIPDHWMGGIYTSDNSKFRCSVTEKDLAKFWRWKVQLKRQPGRFMYRSLSRITLEITDIRVERLQDITPSECTNEGVRIPAGIDVKEYFNSNIYTSGKGTEIFAFSKLWDSIYAKKHPWSSNPWLWVIEFSECTTRKNNVSKVKF